MDWNEAYDQLHALVTKISESDAMILDDIIDTVENAFKDGKPNPVPHVGGGSKKSKTSRPPGRPSISDSINAGVRGDE